MHLHYDEACSHKGMPVCHAARRRAPGASGMSNFKNNLPAFAEHFPHPWSSTSPATASSDKPEVQGNYFTFAATALRTSSTS